MKIFLDTASLKEIEQALYIGILDGVTTNPTLIAKEGKEYLPTVKEIASMVEGPVSAEVLATVKDEMVKEAQLLASVAPNVVVKIPSTKEGMAAVTELSRLGIKTNVTLCFSPIQALLAAKAGANYISPFLGRLDDIGEVGLDLVAKIVTIYKNYHFSTEILAASIRHPYHVLEVALMGADICTMPFKTYMQLFNHNLTDVGLKKFIDDWERTGKKAW